MGRGGGGQLQRDSPIPGLLKNPKDRTSEKQRQKKEYIVGSLEISHYPELVNLFPVELL